MTAKEKKHLAAILCDGFVEFCARRKENTLLRLSEVLADELEKNGVGFVEYSEWEE